MFEDFPHRLGASTGQLEPEAVRRELMCEEMDTSLRAQGAFIPSIPGMVEDNTCTSESRNILKLC